MGELLVGSTIKRFRFFDKNCKFTIVTDNGEFKFEGKTFEVVEGDLSDVLGSSIVNIDVVRETMEDFNGYLYEVNNYVISTDKGDLKLALLQ